MTTTCPKCNHVREAQSRVPAWQCPACGVAYAKVAPARAERARSAGWAPSPSNAHGGSDAPWGKLILGALVMAGALMAYHGVPGMSSGPEISRLAADTKPGDVVMYTTSTCPYCKQAAAWMTEQGFAFTECNTTVDSACARTMQSFGATGVPYLVVKGQHLEAGFDSEEFLKALAL